MPYNPPTKVTTRQMPYLALVSAADPDFQRKKHREVEYEFSARLFVADPATRGAYNSHSNTYTVGQPYGADDPLVTANRPLYAGVSDGRGWA